MLTKRFIVIFLILNCSIMVSAQFRNASAWSYSAYLGFSNLIGDISGKNVNSLPYYEELNPALSRPIFGIGIQRHFDRIGVGAYISGSQFVVDDSYSIYSSRINRNITVHTDMLEAKVSLELTPFAKTRIPLLKHWYINGGFGAIVFQPKARYKNEWVNLQPLGTEGQNYLNNRKPYSRVAMIIPVNVGYMLKLRNGNRMKFDFGFRKTFTDYLDDVSTTYANPQAIAASSGELAAYFADPSFTGKPEGSARGSSSSKDLYMTAGIQLEFSFSRKSANCNQFGAPGGESSWRR